MMTSEILKFMNFTKTQKARYLENETLFFLQIKKIINYISRATLLQKKNSFVSEVTFKCNFNLDKLTIINTFLTNVPTLYPLKIPPRNGLISIYLEYSK